jgi:hypothetical protein
MFGKKTLIALLALAGLALAAAPLAAQSAQADKAVVPLSDPTKPAIIKAGVLRGSITVKAYEGKDVIVEARVREKSLSGEDEDIPIPAIAAVPPARRAPRVWTGRDRDEEDKKRSAAGMKLIRVAATGLEVEEENNEVQINTESWKYATDLVIQAPASSSLEISTTNDGEVTIEGIRGAIEVDNTNGPITLRNVSGSAVLNTVNGDIEVVLTRVAGDKPMSFTTMNGDVDVTLPADLKANIKMKSQMGEIYSDFEVAVKPAPVKTEDSAKSAKGAFRVSFDKAIYGTINGGGPEISFSTFNGDVFIRKGK